MAVKTNERRVQEIITSIATKEGEGFSIRRPFPTRARSYIDPFLLLDHMEPVELGPGEAKGAPCVNAMVVGCTYPPPDKTKK